MCLRFVFLLTTRLAAWQPVVSASGDVEERRDPDPAPQARRPATTPAAPPEPELGGPGPDCGPSQPGPQGAPPRAAPSGHTRHGPALAPRHHPPPLGRTVQARQDRPPRHPPERQGPWSSSWPGRTLNGVTAESTAS